MAKPANLQEALGSKSTNAVDRLKEILLQGISADPIPFTQWREEAIHNVGSTELHPKTTTVFGDGWERYLGLGNRSRDFTNAYMELYVAGHNTVYSYALPSDLSRNLVSLLEETETF